MPTIETLLNVWPRPLLFLGYCSVVNIWIILLPFTPEMRPIKSLLFPV